MYSIKTGEKGWINERARYALVVIQDYFDGSAINVVSARSRVKSEKGHLSSAKSALLDYVGGGGRGDDHGEKYHISEEQQRIFVQCHL